jgi:protein O-GlcNAc transferase
LTKRSPTSAGPASEARLAVAHDNLVFSLHYHPDYDSAALYQEARRWNDQHAEPLAKFRQPHANTADPERRLRIGYVSPDFRNHPVSHFLMPLLSNHDHRQVEIFCYAEVARPDDITERLRACMPMSGASRWGSPMSKWPTWCAQDRIDILVDLALHTAKNRLLVFARKPAPVQVTWLGYPGTTGLSTIDYRLTDPYLDPPGENDSCYSEQSIRLPDTFWCYDP